jgi:type IV secretion/conjugal transfer VirB4 family ATPase
MIPIKEYRSSTKALPDLLNWGALIDDGVVLNKDGSLTAGYYYRGPDQISSSSEMKNAVSAVINRALSRLGNEWMLHQDAIRIQSNQYPDPSNSHFPDPITELIEEERRVQFESEGVHYESLYVLILTYLPESQTKSKLQDMMFDDSSTTERKRRPGDKALEYFKSCLIDIEDLISTVLIMNRMRGIVKLNVHGEEIIQDQLLQYMHYSLTGNSHPINVPPCPMYLDAVIGGHEFWAGVIPKIDNKFIQVIAIDGFPQESYPGMLTALDQMPIKYRWSTRFIFQDSVEAKSSIKKYKRKWQQKVRGFVDQLMHPEATSKSAIDQDAVSMVAEADNALAEASSGVVTFGYYTSVVVLMEENRDVLAESARELKGLINNLGFNARVETLNTVEAFLGSLPGHAVQNLRRPLMHTMHLADLLPVSSIWAGEEKAPCPMYPPDSPPLFHAATEGHTPFRFNLHVFDLGHALIFGPPGAGKSTLLALMAAQFRRYKGATVFAFDKGKSLEALTLAVDGNHYNLGGSTESSDLCFAPLQHIDKHSSWALDWICTLIELQGLKLTPEKRNELSRALTALQNGKVERTLSNFRVEVQNQELKEALDFYCISGPLGQLLDAEADNIESSKFMCFEIEELMKLDDKTRLPVLLYMFFLIESRMEGQPCLLILDEAWLMLGNDVFRKKITEWLKVLRKSNCAVVLATQSLSDAYKSGILDVLTESCPTKVYLANPNAHSDTGKKLYLEMGCNEAEISKISSLIQKRDYFVKGQGNRIFNLNMGPVALSFCGVAGKEKSKEIRALKNKHGQEWPYRWLDDRGVHYVHLCKN